MHMHMHMRMHMHMHMCNMCMWLQPLPQRAGLSATWDMGMGMEDGTDGTDGTCLWGGWGGGDLAARQPAARA